MLKKKPLVSIIIIDYKTGNPYLVECLEAIQKQTYKNFEILLLTDYPVTLKCPKLKIKSYGKYVPPAAKRDEGAKIAKGMILAFIDNDAYPDKNWLKNIVQSFKESEIVGVAGPGVTPPNVNWQEEASGWMSASPLGAGIYTYRFLPGEKRFIDDAQTMNFSVLKKDFLKIGGFDTKYWPGEDTKLSMDLVYKLNKKILYNPNAFVYHHRRPIWLPHLKQNGQFGVHRGFFAKTYPKTSFKPIYFGPSLMVVGLTYILITWGVTNSILSTIRIIGINFIYLYLLALLLNSIWVFNKSKNWFQSLVVMPAVFLTHLWYGIRFIQGFLFTKGLKR